MGSDVYRCAQCQKIMNIAERMVSPVCLGCAKKNHKRIIEGK